MAIASSAWAGIALVTDEGPVDYMYGVSQLRGYQARGGITKEEADHRIAENGRVWAWWAVEELRVPCAFAALALPMFVFLLVRNRNGASSKSTFVMDQASGPYP